MTIKTLLVSAATSLALVGGTIGCSDFTNSDQKKNVPEQQPKPDSTQPGDSGVYDPGFDPNTGDFTEEKMLLSLGWNIISPAVKTLRLQSELLQTKLNEYCDVNRSGVVVETALGDARRQWKQTMLAFHRLDAVAFGPLIDDGRTLADGLYAFPYISTCGIDIEVEKQSRTGQKNSNLLHTLRGLGAVEYLLFEETQTSKCNPHNATLRPVAEWVKKPMREKAQDRCEYARFVTEQVVTLTQALERKWDPQQGNFSKTLIDGSRFKSSKEAVNAVSDSLFSLEQLKDLRLGRPLGFHKDCLDEAGKCPGDVEHPWAAFGYEALEARVAFVKKVFEGGSPETKSGFGFDDYLKKMGRQEVAWNISANLTRVLDSLARLKSVGTFNAAVEAMNTTACRASTVNDRKVEVCSLYQDVRSVTTLLKTDFLLALSLRSPPTYQGDND